MSEWNPIESVPKDGTQVDLWMVDQDGDGERVTNARYVRDYTDEICEYRADGSYERKHVKRDGWFAPGFDYDNQDGFCDRPRFFNRHPRQNKWLWNLPTHWMPLPDPPLPSIPSAENVPPNTREM